MVPSHVGGGADDALVEVLQRFGAQLRESGEDGDGQARDDRGEEPAADARERGPGDTAPGRAATARLRQPAP